MVIYYSLGRRSNGGVSGCWSVYRKFKRLRGQAVKTSPFHGGNTGSIPVGVTKFQMTGSADVAQFMAIEE